VRADRGAVARISDMHVALRVQRYRCAHRFLYPDILGGGYICAKYFAAL